MCKAVHEEVWFYLLLSLVITGKIGFSVKLCASTHEGLARRIAFPGVDSTQARWSQTRAGKNALRHQYFREPENKPRLERTSLPKLL